MAYTNIDDPSAHFQVKKWTGNAGTNAITLDGNSDMQPDFMWHKEQNDTNGWHQFDSSRGVTKYLAIQGNDAEGTFSGYLSSFDSNGFTAGSGDSSMNSSGTAQCSWMWHCNSGTTSSNTDGSITSTVQANTTAGFSIVTFTTDGSTRTVGHGLGVKPDIVLVKSRNVAGDWLFITDVIDGTMDYGKLNGGNAFASISYNAPTSSVFEYNDNNTNTQVAYCFAQKQGYSKFGSYTGNGSTNGPFVYTGFKPAFVIVKNVDRTDDWNFLDNKRDPFNLVDKYLQQDTGAEATYSFFDFVSNGFKVKNTGNFNQSGEKIIYMAFAENPFVTSTGIPTTAR